ncbi:MAG: hypothetical protein JO344_08215 [Planctomycetaceae bacterium]|nr:hypothetical protein [Planctomycetaceae bacterium]
MLRAWFLHRLGRRPRRQGRTQRTSRSRSLVTEMESLEGRALLTATSAVAWTAGLVTHHALYAIGAKDNVEVSVDGGSFTNLGGYAKQVSAGLDVFNKPEVYAIGADNAVWLNKGSGWVSLGGYVTEVGAPAAGNFGISLPAGLAYAVSKGHGGLLHKGSSFSSIGGGTIE